MGNMLGEVVSSELMQLLQFLFPGFITLVLLYNLTSYSKPSSFKKIVLALVFTSLINLLGKIVEWLLRFREVEIKVGQWNELPSLVLTIALSVILALVLAYFANNDRIHKFLRRIRITRETSFSSELYGSLLDKTWIVLHFHDERRLYGWLVEWPSEPTKGHFIIRNPSWIGKDNREELIAGISDILIKANDVRWIEFVEGET